MKRRASLTLILAFGVCLAVAPASSWARGPGGGGSRGGGATGASAGAAGGGAGASSGGASSGGFGGGQGAGATGFGGRSPGRGGFGGYGSYGGRGRGAGYGRGYGRPGTFTGYGDPNRERRGYATSRATAGGFLSGERVRVVDLQRALRERGYYRGPANGRFDGPSIEALRRFRQDRGIAPADFLDRATADALRLPVL